MKVLILDSKGMSDIEPRFIIKGEVDDDSLAFNLGLALEIAKSRNWRFIQLHSSVPGWRWIFEDYNE